MSRAYPTRRFRRANYLISLEHTPILYSWGRLFVLPKLAVPVTRYFVPKDDLLLTLIGEGVATLEGTLDDVLSGPGSPLDRLEAVVAEGT